MTLTIIAEHYYASLKLTVTHSEYHIEAPYAERHSAECSHAECHSAECRHAECRGAVV
jgi:hypothetical protein